jgi:anti-sigma B factor antagonist
MQVETSKVRNVVVVTPLVARIDASVAPDLREKLASSFGAGGDTVILDMHAVDFIDSTGLGAIVSARKDCGEKQDLVLCSPTPTVLSLLKLTRMDKVFRLFTGQDEALHALAR